MSTSSFEVRNTLTISGAIKIGHPTLTTYIYMHLMQYYDIQDFLLGLDDGDERLKILNERRLRPIALMMDREM